MTLQLPTVAHWELRGRPDSALFLRALPEAFSSASTIFVEGTAMAPDIEHLLTGAAEPGPYLPARQTLWPRSVRLRSRFSASLLSELSELAEHHAEPEILDHLFLYADGAPLLEYPDAFLRGSIVYAAGSVAEEELFTWASRIQLEPQWCTV